MLKDSLAFGAFFGGYEACKQTSTRQVAELLEVSAILSSLARILVVMLGRGGNCCWTVTSLLCLALPSSQAGLRVSATRASSFQSAGSSSASTEAGQSAR